MDAQDAADRSDDRTNREKTPQRDGGRQRDFCPWAGARSHLRRRRRRRRNTVCTPLSKRNKRGGHSSWRRNRPAQTAAMAAGTVAHNAPIARIRRCRGEAFQAARAHAADEHSQPALCLEEPPPGLRPSGLVVAVVGLVGMDLALLGLDGGVRGRWLV